MSGALVISEVATAQNSQMSRDLKFPVGSRYSSFSECASAPTRRVISRYLHAARKPTLDVARVLSDSPVALFDRIAGSQASIQCAFDAKAHQRKSVLPGPREDWLQLPDASWRVFDYVGAVVILMLISA